MRRNSLRIRLAVIAAAALAPTIVATWLVLGLVFERHLERRYLEQLDIHVQSVTSRIASNGRPTLGLTRPLSDPRFDRPLSGLYWRLIDENAELESRSRSLWDRGFVDTRLHPADLFRGEATAPDGRRYLLVQRRLLLGEASSPRPVVLQVAMDLQPISAARREFAGELAVALGALGGALALMAWVQVGLGLRPLDKLRAAADSLGRDPAARLPADFPIEVSPAVDAVNRLLEQRAADIEAAYRRADDLAHALKTPLAVLRNQAAKLSAKGESGLGDALKAATQSMEARVGSELSRARAAVSVQSGTGETAVAQLVDRLVGVASKTPSGERLSWENAVPADLTIPIAEADLADVMGPLLENAAQWARTRVRVDLIDNAIVVEDDGPGMPPAARKVAAERGTRLDELGDGTGLGLAIAREILAEYGWLLELRAGCSGGLAAWICGPTE